MAYNTIDTLNKNIRALSVAMGYQKSGVLSEEGAQALREYAGFGGLKAILYPEGDLATWIKSGASNADLKLHPNIQGLYKLLRENLDEKAYHECLASLKNSILTAFYTPSFVPATIYRALLENGITPKKLYDPSAGSGVFITEAIKAMPNLQHITAVEKDLLTGMVLTALNSANSIKTDTHVMGLEKSSNDENSMFDLVASNIPFGNFSIYDAAFRNTGVTGKIHNYFFAKGLDKLADGGIMAYITTDGFLNSPSNMEARRYLFDRADFVALAVMPDNLMKETGNTEAPNHLLIVQKNIGKKQLSADEQLLAATDKKQNDFGSFFQNSYIQQHPEIIIGEVSAGTNQYGQPHEKVWVSGDMTQTADLLKGILTKSVKANLKTELFPKLESKTPEVVPRIAEGGRLTYLSMPRSKENLAPVQLGLFDTLPAENIGRASAYVGESDSTIVLNQTARILGTVRTEDNPDHETVVLLAARHKKSNSYLYKLRSNVKEIQPSASNWLGGVQLAAQLSDIRNQLANYGHTYRFEGDQTFAGYFRFEKKAENIVKELPSFYQEGMLSIYQEKVGNVAKIDRSTNIVYFEPLEDQRQKAFFESYILLRDCYLKLSSSEISGTAVSESERETVNRLYDLFVAKYGQLNAVENRRLILADGYGVTLLCSLERREGSAYVKSDILTQAIVKKEELFTTDSPSDALAHCLNERGKVDIEFMATILGTDAAVVIRSLEGHIYLNPSWDEWETADAYLSGNVVSKLKIAEKYCNDYPENPFFAKSREALEKVQPEHIPFELLDFNLGERWMPARHYTEFAAKLFEQDTEVSYFPSLDTFKVSTKHNTKVDTEFAITPKSGRTMYGYTLLEHALENTSPFFTYEIEGIDGKPIRKPDNEAIQLASQKIEQMRSAFTDYLDGLPEEERREIADQYNEIFNCYVLRDYNGAHQTFPGLDKKTLGIDDLYDSQKNAVWRIVQNRGALVDHEVGLGKTLTMVVGAQELKRLSIVNKPAILALKANIDQIADTYKKAYPQARILFPGREDFTPAKRLQLLHEIKNNNWDCIIMTHEQFEKIPQSYEIQREILETELENVERDVDTAEGLGEEIGKKILKGLEIRKNNLENKLNGIIRDIEEKKDAGITFSDLGIDHLFVDESHKYKNLTFTTRHNRVAGLGNTEGSMRALNMLFAVRTLQDKFNADLCVTFLSGTPISNSLTEMYLIFKYMRPREMARQQIENFDGWAAVFAKKSTDYEFNITNEIVPKERYRHFIKVPELALFYNEITDYKTAKHINLDKPEIDEVLVNIPLTPDQEDFSQRLMEFARTGNGLLIDRPPLTSSEDNARMLIATNYAKKMALDMRLIGSHYADHPNDKVNVCGRKVAEIYGESTPHKGTQIVFCDLGTPTGKGFNVYDALKKKLVEDFNIPSHEIAFIHDWQDRKKPQLCKHMNNGDIRILIGSTEMAGTGLNVQKRIVAMHHLDIPWTPKDLEQRNGRGARQANLIAKEFYDNKVRNFIYAKEKSLDNYKFNLLKNKQLFISQMKNNELQVRTLDEGAMDEKSGMNFSEYIAILSGDNSLLEKSKLEKRIAVMESLRTAHFREVSRNRFALREKTEKAERNTAMLSKLKLDCELYQNRLVHEPDGTKSNPIRLAGFKSNDAEAVGNHIIDLYKNWKPQNEDSIEQKIGNLYGFDLYIRQEREPYYTDGLINYKNYNNFYATTASSGIKYTYNDGFPNIDNPKLSARHFLSAIDRTITLKQRYEKELLQFEQECPQLERLAGKPFVQEEELKNMKAELATLEKDIAKKLADKQAENADSDEETNEEITEAEEVEIAEIMEPEKLEQTPSDKWMQQSYATMRKNNRMKFR
ncbi:helicase-related protein [Flavobacterium lindanitolerans]|uniref:helicase-related protein n=1 Tax=Flavobacterium lindanitolerans TaxID=428988 RepID=UPI0023F36082|nr:helicase-related protein [Flavobacterium lindanitolerans]